MEAKSILDADMATVAGWLRAGMAWWLDELRAMLPAGLRRQGGVLPGFVAWHGPGDWQKCGKGDSPPVLVDPALCLVREMTLPPLGAADLQRLVRLDADRILPIPSAQLVIAARADPADRTRVTVVGLRRETVRAMLEELQAAGIAPTRFGLAVDGAPGAMALDLTEALVDAGMIGPTREAAPPWWVLVGFLFALNGGLLVARDIEEVARLEALVAEQAPAVNAARRIANRIAGGQRQAQELAARRRQQDALGVLAAVTEALPPQAWVQRYGWDGGSVRLSGYKRAGVDVVGALRKSPQLVDVAAADAETVAEVPTGQPFDLTARIRPAAPKAVRP